MTERREVRFSVTPEEWLEITRYVAAKKRWKQVSHFVRDCVFQAMVRNPALRHDLGGKEGGAERTEAPGGRESDG